MERFGAFLGTVPYSEKLPGFRYLEIRALDSSETPVLELDCGRRRWTRPESWNSRLPHLHDDSKYLVRSNWDLWTFAGEPPTWQPSPEALTIDCNAEGYDGSLWKENGHFEADLGLEHFFTDTEGCWASDRHVLRRKVPKRRFFWNP